MGGVTGTILTVGGSVICAYLVLLGVRFTAAKSKEGVDRTADVTEQQSALDAWKDLVQPYRDEVAALRVELADERKARIDKEREDQKDRAEAKRQVAKQIADLNGRIDKLTSELNEWKRLAKTIARWAGRLRDEVLRLGGTVPATPEELLTLQAIENAEQS